MKNEKINQLCTEVKAELEQNILPFWIQKMTDREHGGFYGRITGKDVLEASASKGAILNARILWGSQLHTVCFTKRSIWKRLHVPNVI